MPVLQFLRLGILLAAGFAFFAPCRSQTISANPTGVFVAGGSVRASALQSDGKLVIVGQFVAINGIPRTNVARLNADGSVDLTWNPGASGGIPYDTYVSTVAVHGNDVYIGGTFSVAGGEPRNGLAAIDGSTGLATPWDPNPQSTNFLAVDALAVSDDGGRVFVGGNFTSIGGAERSSLAAVAASDGSAISGWSPEPDGRVEALVTSGDSLYASGYFQSIGGELRVPGTSDRRSAPARSADRFEMIETLMVIGSVRLSRDCSGRYTSIGAILATVPIKMDQQTYRRILQESGG